MNAASDDDKSEPERDLRELIEALTAACVSAEACRRWLVRGDATKWEAVVALEIIVACTVRIEASARSLLAQAQPHLSPPAGPAPSDR